MSKKTLDNDYDELNMQTFQIYPEDSRAITPIKETPTQDYKIKKISPLSPKKNYDIFIGFAIGIVVVAAFIILDLIIL